MGALHQTSQLWLTQGPATARLLADFLAAGSLPTRHMLAPAVSLPDEGRRVLNKTHTSMKNHQQL